MGIIIKNSAVSSVIAYTGVVIGFINIAYIFPRFFTPEELGLRSVLVEFSMIFYQLSLVGFSGVISKFLPYYKTANYKTNGFLFFSLIVPFVIFFIFTFIFFWFKDYILLNYSGKESDHLLSEYGLLIIPISFCMLLGALFEFYLGSYLIVIIPNFLREVFLRLLTMVLLLLVVWHLLSINQFWYAFVLAYVLCFILLVLYTAKIGRLDLQPDFKLFLNKAQLKEISLFAVFSWLSIAGTLIVLKIDLVMLTYMTNLKNIGIYSLAVYITVIIDNPRRYIVQSVQHLVSKAFKDNDMEMVNSLYKKTAVNQLIIGLILFLLMWINIDDIFTFIPNNSIYIQGKSVILFLGLAKVFDMGTGVNSEIISYSKYYRIGLLLLLILGLLNIMLNYFLIPVYGITGAAIATMFSIIIYNTIKFIFLKAKLKLQPFTFETLKIAALALITNTICYFLPSFSHPLINILIKSIIMGITFILPMLIFKVSPEMNSIFNKIMRIIQVRLKI